MTTFTVTHSETNNHGMFVATTETHQQAGEMTYSRANEALIIIDHTMVEPAFSGQGVGNSLIVAAINYARTHSTKIIPLCPFAKSYFTKHPSEVQDILA